MALTATLKKAVESYYHKLGEYKGSNVKHETALRSAFQNLLEAFAQTVNWQLVPEEKLTVGKRNIRPDGTLRDTNYLRCGYWEAKDPGDDLEAEVRKKITLGYPTSNIIFEDTRRAILYQDGKRTLEADLTQQQQLVDILNSFIHYSDPDIEGFERAVQEFKADIPHLAQGLKDRIKTEHARNNAFVAAFSTFLELCRSSLDPTMSSETVDEMLVQHLLTERLFRTIFNNPDFTNRNVIAREIEKVIHALTSREFDRYQFLKALDRYYIAIEEAARTLPDWTEKQKFLNTVYESFFQGFSTKQADTHGVVYTPQEIVEFMCASVDVILQREFNTSLSEPGVQILDPATGTGNFIVNLIQNHINGGNLEHKYEQDLFCNEIMLLPYYIASLNIEHAYYERTGTYTPFEGISFADTLNLEGQQMELFSERNTERIQKQREAQIMVVIGNPPYNVGQKRENDNNKNRNYTMVDKRIRDTYAKGTQATNSNKLYDAYIKFFRWATDRLGSRDGIVCLVSNNGFLDGIAFDGFRKQLSEDFSQIYHIDLGGNARRLDGGNVFDIMVGVGITILVRSRKEALPPYKRAKILYSKPAIGQKGIAKLQLLSEKRNVDQLEWQELEPDEKYDWLTENLHFEYTSFLPLGTREAKSARVVEAGGTEVQTIFKTHSLGVNTNRDNWTYDFDATKLASKVSRMIETYNAELSRWIRGNSPKDIDNFVLADETKIKWSSRLKECFARGLTATFTTSAIRNAMYRPFTRRFLYFDTILTHRQGMFSNIFPNAVTETENTIIWLKTGFEWPMFALATNFTADLLPQGGSQCFPYYTYAEDGSNRRENITDWALAQFRGQYGDAVTKWDIFHYVYAMLHHPVYRTRYAENLKRDLPRIPLLPSREIFATCVRIGKALMELRLHYETTQEYRLLHVETKGMQTNWLVKKMKLTPSKDAVIVNDWLTLTGVPQECFAYRLGNRSALEWVLDQYQVSRDARSDIESDPNRADDPQYIVRLVKRVVFVSVETVKLVRELEQGVTLEVVGA